MDAKPVTGIFTRSPQTTRRIAEGGLRVAGQVKEDSARSPLVSVVTVVRNSKGTLQRCIDSVQSQTFPNVEHIIIDGGSTDGTLEVIAANEASLDYYVSEPDDGIYQAMNKGLRLARGRYLSMLNSDDWLFPDGIEKLVGAIVSWKADFSVGHAHFVDEQSEHFFTSQLDKFDDRILISGMTFCHQAMLVSKRCFADIGLFDESMQLSGDYKWVRQLFLAGKKGAMIPEPVVNFSYTGLTRTHRPIMKNEAKQLFRETFPFVRQDEADQIFEFVYRDGSLDQSLFDLLKRGREDPQFMTTVSMFLLTRLLETQEKLEETKSHGYLSIRKDLVRLLRRIVRKIFGK